MKDNIACTDQKILSYTRKAICLFCQKQIIMKYQNLEIRKKHHMLSRCRKDQAIMKNTFKNLDNQRN